ncbi:MAG: O-antigen ligase family protein [Bacillota bacterium]
MSNSAILGLVNHFISRLSEVYNESLTHRLLDRVCGKLKGCFAGSAFVSFIRSGENTSRFFRSSLFSKILQGAICGLTGLLKKIVIAASGPAGSSTAVSILRGSTVGKVAGWVFKRFVLTICFFIFIQSTVPHQYWHNQYGAIMIALVALLYLLKAAVDARYRPDTGKLDFAHILFFISTAAATFTSITPASSFRIFLFNAMSFVLVLVMVNTMRSEHEIGLVIYWVLAATSVTCFLGLWQYIRGVEVDPLLVDVTFGSVGRVISSMDNPNNYAEYLLLTIPFFGAAFFNTKKTYEKCILVCLTLLSLAVLVLTSSRGSWISFAVSLFVFIFFKNRKLLLPLAVIGVAAVPFLPSSIIARLNTIGRDTSSLYRLSIWTGSWRILQDYWMTGTGLGTEPFMKLFIRYTDVQLPVHSHMLMMQVWIETGLAGLLSFVWMIVRLVKKSAASVFGKKNGYLENIIIACISSLAGILVMGLVEYVWFYPRILVMFWFNIGILTAALNLRPEAAHAGLREDC